jgi:hypothetical protein
VRHRAGRQRQGRRRCAPTRSPSRSSSPACRCGATSAIAPSALRGHRATRDGYRRLLAYFTGLQERIVAELAAFDGKPFLTRFLGRPEGGGGVTRLIEEGNFFERGGVNFSHVTGEACRPRPPPPPRAGRRRWEAMGVSLVLHPRNPYCPTAHMNVRCFVARKEEEDPVWWFGGGMDLTPYYGFEEDAATSTPPASAGAGALRPDVHAALQKVVRRVLLPQAPQRSRAASAASSSTT